MQHKRLAAVGLTLALAGSMTGAALAADGLLIAPNPISGEVPMVIAPNPNAYRYAITVNGEAVDTAGIPNIDGLPVRLVAEADHGYAGWYAEENSGSFAMSGGSFTLDFSDNSVSTFGEKLDVTANVVSGVTFLPISFFEGLEGVTVTVSGGAVDITTPNNDPLVKLSYELGEVAGGVRGGALDRDNLENFSGFHADSFQDGLAAGSFPMMVSPDTLLIGKLAEGGEETLKADWDAYVARQKDTFSWYLSHHLPKVEDARFEVENGYVLCLIAENADAAVAAFRAAVKDL